jgi:hypothetical protein
METKVRQDVQAGITIARFLLENINDRIDSADIKARILVAANSIVMGFTAFAFKDSIGSLREGGTGPVWIATTIAATVLVISATISSAFALWVIRPRIVRSQSKSLFFWEDIRQMPLEQFTSAFKALTPEETLELLVSEIHGLSSVASQKFRWAFVSSVALVAAIAAWAILLVLVGFFGL